jgi:phosphatidylglycerol---prolipoprotein diacylglyceryl transferase
MRRILFRIAGVPVYSYAAMLYVGIVCGMGVQQWAAVRDGLDPMRVLIATIALLVPALVGARLLHVAMRWKLYRSDPRRIRNGFEGGAAMYGGLLLAVPLSVPVLATLALPFGAFWDGASLTMLVGMCWARVGCLLNGCCSGRVTDGWLGLSLPDHRGRWARRMPTQILEGIWGAIVLGGAIVLHDRLPFAGATFLYTVAAYSAGRIALERTRYHQDIAFGVALNGALSTMFIAVSLAAFAIVWLRL